jgi:hypothetical protein
MSALGVFALGVSALCPPLGIVGSGFVCPSGVGGWLCPPFGIVGSGFVRPSDCGVWLCPPFGIVGFGFVCPSGVGVDDGGWRCGCMGEGGVERGWRGLGMRRGRVKWGGVSWGDKVGLHSLLTRASPWGIPQSGSGLWCGVGGCDAMMSGSGGLGRGQGVGSGMWGRMGLVGVGWGAWVSVEYGGMGGVGVGRRASCQGLGLVGGTP